MSREQEDAETMALRKIQESDLWWNAFHKSVREWRRMNVYHIGCRRRLEMAEAERYPPRVELMAAMRREADYAHDILLSIISDVESSARSAVSCEMAHTIYQEQQEQKFWRDDGEYDY